MVPFVNVLKAQIKEQEKEIALHNCFKSWDDELCEDVIIQGVHSRLHAIGKPVEGIAIIREDINTVSIITSDNQKIIRAVRYPNLNTVENYGLCKGILHDHEVTQVSQWLVDNFYH